MSGHAAGGVGAATLRFHGELVGLLAARRRGSGTVEVGAGRSVKDAIESAGIPHTEVDLLVASGPDASGAARHSVEPSQILTDGDVVDVYGRDRPASLAAEPGLLPDPPQPIRFVLDGHLGTLARYLRMLGFDAAYSPHAADDELAGISEAEGRVVLSRDRGLLKRSIVRYGYLVRRDSPAEQLVEVADRFGLRPLVRAFTRCVRCNGEIVPAALEEVAAELRDQPRTLRYFDSFGRCLGCRAIYWQGSHFDRMRHMLASVLSESN